MSETTITILSLGAGVQSSTLLLMSCLGDLPKPDAAIFADTQWESQATYRHLEFLKERAQEASIPVYQVSAGNLKEDIVRAASDPEDRRVGHVGQPPFFVKNGIITPLVKNVWSLWGEESILYATPDKGGRLWRKCTAEYKLAPIKRKARELMGEAGAKHIDQWIGISTDEAVRMKPSGVKYITNVYPLVSHGLSRMACLAWLVSHGFQEPEKSSCLGCPFHSNAQWRHMRDTSPVEWAETCVVDNQIRHGIPGVKGDAYMHRTMMPLADAPIDLQGEAQDWQLHLFDEECEGMCGI